MARGDARAVVGEFHLHHVRRREGADHDLAVLAVRLQRLARVAEDVHEDLLQLVRIRHDDGQLGRELRDDLDVAGAQVVGHDLQHLLDHGVELHELALGGVLAREAEQALHDLVAAVRALGDELEVGSRLFVGGHLREQIGEPDDGGQRVVQFVRHAGHELPDRRKLLALHELRLGALEGGDGFLQLGPRGLQVFRHAVEALREVAALVVGKSLDAPGKIAAADRLGRFRQVAERMRHAAYEPGNHDAAHEDARDAEPHDGAAGQHQRLQTRLI